MSVGTGAGTARPALNAEQVVEQDGNETGVQVGGTQADVEREDGDPRWSGSLFPIISMGLQVLCSRCEKSALTRSI